MKPTLSVIITTFVGGAVAFVGAHLDGGIPAGDALRAFAIGAAIAGVSALVHLYQDAPGSSSASGGGPVPGSGAKS